VSLIESALEKLRRDAQAEGEVAASIPRSISSTVPSVKVAMVVPAALEEPSKGIAIDITALRSAGYLPEEGLERRFADHYRQIKRPLVEKALAGPAEMRLILISSALPGDGKTFTSINLALSMARERDISVLLVDADGPRARISEVLGIRTERGLLDALADETLDVESLIQRTDVRGLDILPAGRFIENATELLASARMSQIATRMAARNPRRLVLFDSAPLLVSSEARVLLRIPGQVVLVVRAGVTPRQAILEAVGHVDKTKLQGLILNQTPFQKGSSYYDYGGYRTSGDEASSTG
jgi:protein-tyrosine kinase